MFKTFTLPKTFSFFPNYNVTVNIPSSSYNPTKIQIVRLFVRSSLLDRGIMRQSIHRRKKERERTNVRRVLPFHFVSFHLENGEREQRTLMKHVVAVLWRRNFLIHRWKFWLSRVPGIDKRERKREKDVVWKGASSTNYSEVPLKIVRSTNRKRKRAELLVLSSRRILKPGGKIARVNCDKLIKNH